MDAASERKLLDFIPTFSEDGINAEMPVLKLQLQGLSGEPLSDNAYDAIQYAMSDYLRDFLQEKWPSTSTSDYDAGAQGDAAEARNEDGSSSKINAIPALTNVKTEILADRPIARRSLRSRDLQAAGNEVDVLATLTFRDLESAAASENNGGIEYHQGDSDSSVPSEEVLSAAAGDAWNDLTAFEEYLFEAVGREDDTVKQQFVTLEGLASAEDFPTSPPTAAPTPAATPEATTATEGTTGGDGGDETDADRGDSTVAGVEEGNPVVQSSGGINPLYPALIAGFAVFLCTIIVLGYRRRRPTDLIGNKDEHVQVHDTFNLDGDEEIEVENPYFESDKKQKNKSRSFRSRSVKQPQDDMDDDNSEVENRSKPTFCVRPPGMRAPQNLDQTYDESFEEDEQYESEHSGIPPPSIGDVDREDMDLYADLTQAEKQQFLRYMHSGMSIEEASQLVLEARQNHASARYLPQGGSGSTSTRSKQRLDSEVMADGRTTVHIPEQLADGNAPSSRRFQSSLVLAETDSSVNSSFDDRDYHQSSKRGGGLLNLGRSKRNANSYSDLGNSGRKSRGEKTSGKAMGQNIMCYPESQI
ncbi:MAG: hypothetical protein SGILL_002221 [Bacillariaceae sp.]